MSFSHPRTGTQSAAVPVGLRAAIRAALAAAPAGRTTAELADVCYAGATPPLTWDATVRGQIRRLRPVVRAEGYEIVRLGPYGPNAGPYVMRRAQQGVST